MSTQSNKLYKKGSLLGFGFALSYIFSFFRNALIGHLLSKDDFGIAATFTMVVSLLEMLSWIAVEKLLVQAEDGDDPKLQAAAHVVLVLRGLIVGAVLLFGAGYFAAYFNAPETENAFRVLALLPLIRGFMHLDPVRYQRELRYTPFLVIEIIPQALILALAYFSVLFIGSYHAVLALLILQVITFVIGSHYYAERPYRLSFDKIPLWRIIHFGWPLTVSAIPIFLAHQGDKFVVGRYYDLATLGGYAAASLLAIMPMMFFGRIYESLFLPILSRLQNDKSALNEKYNVLNELSAALCVLISLFFIILGGAALEIVFGPKYHGAGVLMAVLGVAWTLRLLYNIPVIATIALGDTKSIMHAHWIRALALGLTLLIALKGGSVEMIAGAAASGEILAMSFMLYRSNVLHDLSLDSVLKHYSVFLVFTLIGFGVTVYLLQDASLLVLILSYIALSVVACAVMLGLFKELRGAAHELLDQGRDFMRVRRSG